MSRIGFLLAILTPIFLAGPAVASALRVELRASESETAPVTESVELYRASHALVIGNDLYSGNWPRLSNAVKDAKLVAKALEEKGFTVTLKTNLKSRELIEALETFFYETGQNSDARLLLWYAGHGFSERGEGYLVPIDAPDPSETGPFLRKALSLRRMGEYVRGASALHVLSIFDSCFAGTVFNVGRAKPPAGITRATTRQVRQFLTSGDAGQEVSDDGTFRKLFIRALNGEVRADANGDGYLAASELGLFMTSEITNYSNGTQTPRNGKLNDPDLNQGDFIFKIAALAPPAPVEKPTPPAPTAGRSVELLFWDSVKDSNSPADFEDYLAQFPDGTFTGLAQRRIAALKNPPKKRNLPARPEAEVAFWNSIQASRNAADFEDYRKRFPGGVFDNLAKRRIEALRKPKIVSRTDFGQKATGTYSGHYTSKGKKIPITTQFYLDGNGTLQGKYVYGNGHPGTLTNTARTGTHGYSFRWREKAGSGDLTLTFDRNFGSFGGEWGWAGSNTRNRWVGSRATAIPMK